MLACPFCGALESERIDLEGKRFIVFPCMFTPEVDPGLSDDMVAERLRAAYPNGGDAFFRGMCDRLHLYVVKGEGARPLRGAAPPRDPGGSG